MNSQKTPISHPHGWAMGCILWVLWNKLTRYMGTTLWFKTGSIFYGLEFIWYQLDMSYYKWQITMYYWFYSYVAAQAKWLITINYRLRHDSDKLELSVFYFNTARYWRLNQRHTKKHIWITCMWRKLTPTDPTVYFFFFYNCYHLNNLVFLFEI